MSVYGGPDIIRRGLVLYIDPANIKSYPRTGSSCFDLSKTGNTCSTNGGTSFSSQNNGYLTFDGVNRYLSLSNIVLNTNTGFTFDMWIYITDPQANGDNWAYWYSNFSGGDMEWGVYLTGQGNFLFKDTYVGTVSSGYIGNRWAHLSFGCQARTAFMYVDGKPRTSSANWTSNNITITDLWRNQVTFSRQFKGYQGDLRIYNRALSAAEVLQNYNATKGRFI